MLLQTIKIKTRRINYLILLKFVVKYFPPFFQHLEASIYLYLFLSNIEIRS